MTKGTVAAATLAGLGIVGTTVTFITRGAIPDVLVMLTTTALGGFLGVSVPGSKA